MEKEINEIPFGAKDSELYKFEYSIPEGYEAEINDEKVIMKKKESEDERIRKGLLEIFNKAQFGEWGKLKIKDIIAYLEKQKEQKPIEWSEDFEQNIRILLHDKLTWHSEDGSMSSTVFIDDKTLKDIVTGIWFYVGKEASKYPNKELKVEQKPAEWSEEDEQAIEIACNALGKYPHPEELTNYKIAIGAVITKLKSFRFKPKHEWSEEERRLLRNAENAVYQVASAGIGGYTKKDYEEISSFFRTLRPQPHWKPSEKQMKALKVVARGFPADDPDAIDSLLTDLQKLL